MVKPEPTVQKITKIQEILDEGGAKARIVAGETLNRVYDALGLVPGITNQR